MDSLVPFARFYGFSDSYLLVDPVQTEEESLKILGVFNTLSAAKDVGFRIEFEEHEAWREVEIQHWFGSGLVGSWRLVAGMGWVKRA